MTDNVEQAYFGRSDLKDKMYFELADAIDGVVEKYTNGLPAAAIIGILEMIKGKIILKAFRLDGGDYD
jgi:hypothetical protein